MFRPSRTALSLAALVLLAGWVQPARASTGYAPPQRVQTCTWTLATVSAVADGGVWGVTGCDAQLSLVHRTPGGTWSRRPLPYRGIPRAVADDGRTTFLLFASPYAPAANRLSIAKVPHGGAPSPVRVLVAGAAELPEAALVARDGRWWAVWDVVDPQAPVVSRLYQARTLEPALPPTRVDLGSSFDGWPRLALRGSGAVLTVTRRLGDDGTQGTRALLATAGPDGRFTARPIGIPGLEPVHVWDLAVAGGGTLLALGTADGLHVAVDNGHLVFSARRVPLRAPAREVALAASGGRVFVAHSEAFRSAAGLWTGRAYVAEGGVTGPLTTGEVSAPFGRVDPAVQVELQDVTAARGRATVLTRTYDALWSQTQG